ncbi:probable cytochrome P450 4ac2 [Polistes fuscatus]|uniref:probable cytochrome P450 4ac2 n=1 Tax=Polistes fuscatus TaxID=30207 RepID=UPI001CAA1132|nr:probable cytochrome P450 4ac2 [Polistes fuscatus]
METIQREGLSFLLVFSCVAQQADLNLRASIWEIHRKILNPVFKEKMVSSYVASMVKNSNRLNNILETTNGKNIDFRHYVHLCTLDIILESLLESYLNLQSNPDCKFGEYMSKMMDITIALKFWLHPNILFNNSSKGKRLQEYLSHINKITSEGSDTAANTLSFLFLMLATFPDIQNQCSYGRYYNTMEDTKKMKNLDRVIKETLRLFPAAPFIARKLYRDTRGIFTYNKIYFSQIFGMTQMQVIAATLLRKFLVRIDDPVSVENIDLKFRITLQPAETIFLRFNKR